MVTIPGQLFHVLAQLPDLQKTVNKGKPPDLQDYFRLASEQETPEPSMNLISKFVQCLNRQGVPLYAGQSFPHLFLVAQIGHTHSNFLGFLWLKYKKL